MEQDFDPGRCKRLGATLDAFLSKPRPGTNADGVQAAYDWAANIRERLLAGVRVTSTGDSSIK